MVGGQLCRWGDAQRRAAIGFEVFDRAAEGFEEGGELPDGALLHALVAGDGEGGLGEQGAGCEEAGGGAGVVEVEGGVGWVDLPGACGACDFEFGWVGLIDDCAELGDGLEHLLGVVGVDEGVVEGGSAVAEGSEKQGAVGDGL